MATHREPAVDRPSPMHFISSGLNSRSVCFRGHRPFSPARLNDRLQVRAAIDAI